MCVYVCVAQSTLSWESNADYSHTLPPGLSGSKRTSETGREESGGWDPCVRLFLDPGRGRRGQRVCRCGVPADKGAQTACLLLGFLGRLGCLGIYQDKAICIINKV